MYQSRNVLQAVHHATARQIHVSSTGSLCNKVEKRLQQCLPYLAKSLGKLVTSSDNPDLQTHACQLMSCELDSLKQELELRLQASPSYQGRFIPVCHVSSCDVAGMAVPMSFCCLTVPCA